MPIMVDSDGTLLQAVQIVQAVQTVHFQTKQSVRCYYRLYRRYRLYIAQNKNPISTWMLGQATCHFTLSITTV
jgi:hypothetical protein